MWPFEDGLEVARVAGRHVLDVWMEACGQVWDVRLQRWLARVPGVDFPIPNWDDDTHERAAAAARVLFAEMGAA